MSSFFRELRRRNVHKVAASYAVVAWLVFELLSGLLFGFDERARAMTGLVVILSIGFVFALYISWAFEATPQGMKRTANVPADAVLPTWSRRKYATFLVGTALLATALLAFNHYRSPSHSSARPVSSSRR